MIFFQYEIMRIIDRLDKYIAYKGLNDNKVTVSCGLSSGLLSQARGGKCDIGKKSLDKILNFYQDLNRVWLITGVGDMLNTPSDELTAPADSDDTGVFVPNEILELLKNQSEAIASQQRTIELLTRQRGHDVQQDEAADCADVG